MYRLINYELFAKKHNLDSTYPTSVDNLEKYLRFKRETNKHRSLQWHLCGLATHPSHGEDWKKKILQDRRIDKLMEGYRKEDKMLKKRIETVGKRLASPEQVKEKVDREEGGGYRAVYNNESMHRVDKEPGAKGFVVVDCDSGIPEDDVLELTKQSRILLRPLREYEVAVLIKK
ncbi:hypothetical protein CLU79DRAFT_886082 [Phycomyces nitens]|nr:hypothetical protein CLU79DRAFT_886082 [Phycomyces nitens]